MKKKTYLKPKNAWKNLFFASVCITAPLLSFYIGQNRPKLVSPMPSTIVYAQEIQKPIEQDGRSERERMVDYLQEVFGDASVEAITVIRACENGTFDPKRTSGLNIQKDGRRSYDVGLMQVNVDEGNTTEIERLKDYKYNIDEAYKKYKAGKNSFYYWTCGKVVGHKTYADNLKK